MVIRTTRQPNAGSSRIESRPSSSQDINLYPVLRTPLDPIQEYHFNEIYDLLINLRGGQLEHWAIDSVFAAIHKNAYALESLIQREIADIQATATREVEQ